MDSALMTDISSLLISGVSVCVIGTLAIRTTGRLGDAFRLMLAAPIILTISAVAKMGEQAGILPAGQEEWIHYSARFIATAFLVAGMVVFLRAIEGVKKEDPVLQKEEE